MTSPTGRAKAHSQTCHRINVNLRIEGSVATSIMPLMQVASVAAAEDPGSSKAMVRSGTSLTGHAKVRSPLHPIMALLCVMEAE